MNRKQLIVGSCHLYHGCTQMFARKYERLAREYSSTDAVFLEILGDESSDTRVSTVCCTPAHASSEKFVVGCEVPCMLLSCIEVAVWVLHRSVHTFSDSSAHGLVKCVPPHKMRIYLNQTLMQCVSPHSPMMIYFLFHRAEAHDQHADSGHTDILHL